LHLAARHLAARIEPAVKRSPWDQDIPAHSNMRDLALSNSLANETRSCASNFRGLGHPIGDPNIFIGSYSHSVLGLHYITWNEIARPGIPCYAASMIRNDTAQNAASKLVIELRKALGQTQQVFASEIKTAVTTIGRWETNNPPPRGDALIKLAGVAERHGYGDSLANQFRRLYFDEAMATLGRNAKVGATGSATTGYVVWNRADNKAPGSADFYRNAADELLKLAQEIELAKRQKR
jgi:transcriptional regulator with XRE-family HTH domain